MSFTNIARTGSALRERARAPVATELAQIPWLQRLTDSERQRAVDALVVTQAKTQTEAHQLLNRSNSALAFVSGRLGRWLTPTFVVAETSEVNRRNTNA